MTMTTKHFLLAALLLTAITTAAQHRQQTTTPIRLSGVKQRTGVVLVKNHQLSKLGNNKTAVQMDIVLDSLRVPSNRYRAFTPIIVSTDGKQEQRLKSLLVSGRTQNIVFERDGIDPLYANNCENVRRQNGEAQHYDYTDVIDRQAWHKDAQLFLECDLCGCGDPMKSERFPLLLPKPTAGLDFKFAYRPVVPAPDAKIRNLHGSAYITFVVDRWEMKPDYMQNRRELRKITDTLDIMVADPYVTVNRIKIHGWASPESPYKHNEMLANNRARSLTEWLKQNYDLPDSAFAKAEATPENWIGLREAIEKMDGSVLPHWQEILDLIDNTDLDPDVKEHRIRAKYPQDYRYLLRNVYPGLRRSDYDITFNIRQFTLAEAKEVYKSKPHQLSLRELYDVAHDFLRTDRDSVAYLHAMQAAYNLYPDSTAAVINLAQIALEKDDLLKAETLLEHAGASGPAENARAILYMKQKRWTDAEAALMRAEQAGQTEKSNRSIMEMLRKQAAEEEE